MRPTRKESMVCVYIYTAEYFSKRRNVPFERKWMQLERIRPGKLSQSQKHKYYISFHFWSDLTQVYTDGLKVEATLSMVPNGANG